MVGVSHYNELSAQLVGGSPVLIPKFLKIAHYVDNLWTSFNVEQESLLSALIDLDKIADFDHELESTVRDMVALIQVVVDECNQSSVAMNSFSTSGSMDVPSQNGTSLNFETISPLTSDTRSARLPKIPLPSFNGTIHAWPVFRDRFKVLVHKTNLSNIEKYYYLLNCLQPCAAEVINGITVSSETYAQA